MEEFEMSAFKTENGKLGVCEGSTLSMAATLNRVGLKDNAEAILKSTTLENAVEKDEELFDELAQAQPSEIAPEA